VTASPTTLAALIADPARVVEVPVEQVPPLLATIASEQARLAAVQGALAARLAAREPATARESDQLVTVDEAAAMLKLSRGWLYKNAAKLPFARRVGSRALRFSTIGIRRYLARIDRGNGRVI
jgi:predicted DNA-binding transcriptional regulator AlpA